MRLAAGQAGVFCRRFCNRLVTKRESADQAAQRARQRAPSLHIATSSRAHSTLGPDRGPPQHHALTTPRPPLRRAIAAPRAMAALKPKRLYVMLSLVLYAAFGQSRVGLPPRGRAGPRAGRHNTRHPSPSPSAGVPVWWKTTEIHRPPLPHDDMQRLALEVPRARLALPVHIQAYVLAPAEAAAAAAETGVDGGEPQLLRQRLLEALGEQVRRGLPGSWPSAAVAAPAPTTCRLQNLHPDATRRRRGSRWVSRWRPRRAAATTAASPPAATRAGSPRAWACCRRAAAGRRSRRASWTRCWSGGCSRASRRRPAATTCSCCPRSGRPPPRWWGSTGTRGCCTAPARRAARAPSCWAARRPTCWPPALPPSPVSRQLQLQLQLAGAAHASPRCPRRAAPQPPPAAPLAAQAPPRTARRRGCRCPPRRAPRWRSACATPTWRAAPSPGTLAPSRRGTWRRWRRGCARRWS
jgi:hypothetical protein